MSDQNPTGAPSAPETMPSFAQILMFVARRWLAHPKPFVATLTGMTIAMLADISTPLLAGRLVEDVSHSAETAALRSDALQVLGGLIGLGLAGVLGRRISFVGITRLTVQVMRSVATEAFARVQRFSTDWHANTFAGSTVRRLTRGMWAIDTLDDTLLLLILPEVMMLGGTTVVLTLHSWLLGVVMAVMTVLFIAVSILLTLRYVAPSAQASNRWDTRIGAAMADAITCNAVVKAFGAETREERRLARTLRAWGRRTARTWIRGTNSGNIQALLSLVMRMSLVGLAIWFWTEGQAGPGEVAYVLTMVFLVQGYLRDIGQQIANVQRSVNEMEELVAVFSRAPGVRDAPDAVPADFGAGHIRFEDVTFRYPGQERALYEHLTLDIPAGSRVALVGPSGSGKTTLTKLIERLYDVQSGRITIDGADIAGLVQSTLRERIALVPQEPLLFHRTLGENISYARPGASLEEIREAARRANALSFVERLPQGFDTLVGERGVKLSGGERQRIAIARAFLADAPVLVFDEATSSLDSESEALVQEAMERLMLGRTVIVVAHRLSTIMELDRILVFSHGEVREDGTHAELIRREGGVYRRLFELQSLSV